MSDLIEKFFRADLSEAEENLLSEELLRSEGAAERFESLAEQKYRSYGLPEPVGKGSAGGCFLGIWGKSILLFLGGAAIFGAAIFAVQNCMKRGSDLCHSTPLEAQMGSVTPAEEASFAPPVAQTEEGRMASHPASVPPPPVASNAEIAKGKGLKIAFKMATEGRALVRVFGKDGQEVRRLFEGDMKAGAWTVHWDGLLADGQRAVAGLYQVEVTTNGVSKMREVRLR